MSIKVERLETAPSMPLLKAVRVKVMGNIIQIQAMENCNHSCAIRRLDRDTYMDVRTGEVGEVCHMANREQDKKSLARSMRELREIINTNVTNVKHVRWVTLTYAENMTDTGRLYDDFRKFNQRFQYYLAKNGYGKAEYICCVEPQGRGAWHCHVLFIWNGNAPFIPNGELERIWGHGFTKITALDSVDNVGVYLTAYLTDASLEEIDETGITVHGRVKGKYVNGKKYIKGARLSLYPANCRLYRNSQGIRKPVSEWMSPDNAGKKVKKATLIFEKNVRITDTETGFNTVISTQEYNKARTVK